ncbi:hypothetical protein [uncultured Gammaproteobacteria bacterium]|nr:hypothetical protein BROOK1789C_714 [Bathymodiolus brooksi thiotrophic gill symbiont]CAC9599283.1 hypothetical protein [uncultured Gammaproteobacteria bacterium]CAC9602207.1 hypothetical protein [uncultured Gammaproteobacteria bacterium]CAC9613828.1 hypothetical protein [uncultured Gammaproteobacteria bacterium]SHE22160.1 hypothetical protein BBROOKSOX_94 [Bathymodiolus brooksi thiotrophic gill symbiont]
MSEYRILGKNINFSLKIDKIWLFLQSLFLILQYKEMFPYGNS